MFFQCLLRSKTLSLSILSASQPPLQFPALRSESAPDGQRRRAPQTATGRRRADGQRRRAPRRPQTPESALRRPQDAGERPDGQDAGERPPDGHRTPESAPDGRPERPRERRRAPQTARRRRAPRRPQTPESAPDGQDAGERPRRATATGRRRAPESLFSARSNLSSWTRLRVWNPLKPPFFLSNPSRRAPARTRAHNAPAREILAFDWSHGRDYMVTWDVTYWGRDETARIVARRRDQELRAGTANEAAGGRRNLERLAKRAGMTPQDAAFGNEPPRRCPSQKRSRLSCYSLHRTPLSSAGSRSTPSAR